MTRNPWNDFDQLHLVQAQLAAAQREEVEALLSLSAYTASLGHDVDRFDRLASAASEAGARTDRLMIEWKRLVKSLTVDT